MTPCPHCMNTMELDSNMVHRCENPDCEPDPWELLRELIFRFDTYCKPPDGNKGLAWFHLCSGIKQLETELKQHDEGKPR